MTETITITAEVGDICSLGKDGSVESICGECHDSFEDMLVPAGGPEGVRFCQCNPMKAWRQEDCEECSRDTVDCGPCQGTGIGYHGDSKCGSCHGVGYRKKARD